MPLTIIKSVAHLLKEETIEAHAKAENLLTPKLASIKTYDDYAAVLKMFYGYFHPLEKITGKYITNDVLSDVDERRNSLSILYDLESIDCLTEYFPLCDDLNDVSHNLPANSKC